MRWKNNIHRIERIRRVYQPGHTAPIYALWTRCPSTGWVGGSTVPKHWLPAETVVTFISAKRVPVGTKNGKENRKRKI